MKLRTRVTTLFFLQTIAIAAYIFFYWQPHYIAHIEQRETASERNTLRLIVPAIVEPLLKGELSQVYEMLDEQREIQRNWAKIELVNQQGIQIYPLSEYLEKKSQTHGEIIYLRQDVISGEDTIATLAVELDLSSIVGEESDYLNSLLWLLFCGLVISAIVLGYFLDHSIGKPIQILAKAAEKLKKGDFSVTLPQSGNHRRDEINTLLSSFSEMRDSLQTSQTKLEANASRLKAVLDTVNDGILMIDKNGIMISANHSMFTLFGYTEDELLGQSVNILMEPKQADKHDQILADLTKIDAPLELGRDRKMHALRKNGEAFPIELNISEVWHSNQKKYVATIRDI
ncbi:MAG: PAS domain S-box protein, partial [Gammaproteobacteria bacterium]|nr:PAS domain S-box protein [Gammaproteobacteria bacterium]